MESSKFNEIYSINFGFYTLVMNSLVGDGSPTITNNSVRQYNGYFVNIQ